MAENANFFLFTQKNACKYINLPSLFTKNEGEFSEKAENALRNAINDKQKPLKFLGTKIFS